MKPRVYIESSVVSYLTAKTSRDPIKAACQQVTLQWWSTTRMQVDAYISGYVVDEISAGDPVAASERIQSVRELPVLPSSSAIPRLAKYLLQGGGLPAKAELDALHIATAAFHGLDVLLTWNCTHIANPVQLPVIRGLCAAQGYRLPELVTPFELMGIAL
jgi:predicted nucleic acid-binding protein